jgi:hypothetical protein
VKSGLKAARKAVIRFGKKVQKLSPNHITDPAVSAALSERGADAVQRVDGLRDSLDV